MGDLSNQATHPDDTKREVLKDQALALRTQRASYRKIGAALGVSASTAYSLVTEALAETKESNLEAARELRKLEVALLDEMTVKLWPKPTTDGKPGKLDARTADTILRIAESRRKLLGLDAPSKIEAGGAGAFGTLPAGPLDVSQLSLDQLRQLETMYREHGVALQLTAGDGVKPPPGVPVVTVAAPVPPVVSSHT